MRCKACNETIDLLSEELQALDGKQELCNNCMDSVIDSLLDSLRKEIQQSLE